jgi:hypothetical protein
MPAHAAIGMKILAPFPCDRRRGCRLLHARPSGPRVARADEKHVL